MVHDHEHILAQVQMKSRNPLEIQKSILKSRLHFEIQKSILKSEIHVWISKSRMLRHAMANPLDLATYVDGRQIRQDLLDTYHLQLELVYRELVTAELLNEPISSPLECVRGTLALV